MISLTAKEEYILLSLAISLVLDKYFVMGEIKLETVQGSILITLRRFWMSRERPARSFRFAISP